MKSQNSISCEKNNIENCWHYIMRVPLFEFGWDMFRQITSIYNTKGLRWGQTRADMFVELYCQKTGTNMMPYFNFYNVEMSPSVEQACGQLPLPPKITKWLAVVNCVTESLRSNGRKDIMKCSRLPMFPQHQGI